MNRVFATLIPPEVVTKILAVPGIPAGVVQVILVALTTVKDEQAVPPTDTAVAPGKSVPVIVIGVPPTVLPEVGVTAVTVGAEVMAGTVITIVSFGRVIV